MLHQDQFICRAGAPFRPTVSLLRLSMADGDAPGNPSGAVGGVRFSRNARRRSEAKRISDRITSRSTIRLGWPLGNTPTLNLYSRIRMRPSIPCAGPPLCAQEQRGSTWIHSLCLTPRPFGRRAGGHRRHPLRPARLAASRGRRHRWQGDQIWRAAVGWPVFEGGDVMLIAANLVAKLTVYPIVEGRTAVTRPTNLIYAGEKYIGIS